MRKAGVRDSKIMAADSVLRHGTAGKTPGQRVNEKHFDKLYEAIQEPDFIYEQLKSGKKYRAFHFVKVIENGKIKVVVYQKDLKNSATSLQVTTIGEGNYEYEKTICIKKFGSRQEGSRSPLHSISGFPALGLLLIRLLAGGRLQYGLVLRKGQAARFGGGGE
jgi:hypothetical protein